MADNNTVILRVSLDEGKTLDQLEGLVGEIEKTKKAQAELLAAKKAGSVTEEEYKKRTVELRQQLKAQQQEQSALTRTLDTYRAATGKATGSVDQLKAQSSLLTAQYNAMSQEQRENTEAGRELAAQLEATNEALLKAGQRVGDNRRAVGGYAAGIKEAVRESGFLGSVTAKVTEIQATFTSAQNIAKAAIGGNVTALGFLRLALLATGLGALVVVLGSVVAFLTKSQAGIDLVNRKLAGLKAIVSLVTGAAADFGETLFKAFDNPKQALSDLVDFIGTNLLNRLKSLKIIFDGITSGSINQVSDGLFQLSTGFTDVTGKVRQFANAAQDAAKAGEAIEVESQRILRAERELNVERSQSRARIEELKKLSDDSTKSVLVRTAAAKEAARIENGLLAQQLKLQDDKIANRMAEANLDKQLTNDELDSIAELRSARADTQQESLTLQTELQNKINSLAQEGLDKTIAGRAQSLALQKAVLDKELAQVQANSDQELALLRAKLENERQTELNVKDLTVKQKAKIDVDYETKALKLTQDYTKQRALAAYDAALAANAAELAAVRQGTAAETELKIEAINTQLEKELAALDKRQENTARAAQLRATAEKSVQDLRFSQAEAATEKYLQGERNVLDEQRARGLLSEKAYDKAVLDADVQAANTRLSLARSFGQQTDALEQQLATAKIAKIRSVTEAEQAEQAKRIDLARNLTTGLTDLFAETIATTGAGLEDFARRALILLIDSAEKSIIASQIEIVAKSFATADSIASFGVTGFVRSAAIIAAVAGASEILKAQLTPPPKQFAQGGLVAIGPSHAQGGINLYHQGRPAGYNIEGGEPILTAAVSRNPVLLGMASTINQLAGGRALAPGGSHLALGGVTKPLALQQLRGSAGEAITTEQLMQAFERVKIYTRTQDTQDALERRKYTETQSTT